MFALTRGVQHTEREGGCVVVLRTQDVGICGCQYVTVKEIYDKNTTSNQIRNVSEVDTRDLSCQMSRHAAAHQEPPIRQETGGVGRM